MGVEEAPGRRYRPVRGARAAGGHYGRLFPSVQAATRFLVEVPTVRRRFADAFPLLALLGVLLITSACSFSASQSKPGPISEEERARIEAEILELNSQLDKAYQSNDLDKYWSFYADDITQIWDSGHVTLEQYKKDWTALIEGGGGVVESRMEDVRVRVSPMGDAAVVTSSIFARYRGPDGAESAGQYYETDIWFLRDGRWTMVHYHWASAAEEES